MHGWPGTTKRPFRAILSCGGSRRPELPFENNDLYAEYADVGRMRFTNDSAALPKFKVQSLCNLGYTAPYIHDGSLESLEEVIEHDNHGGIASKSPLVQPLHLTNSEKKDLLAFLLSLSVE